MAKVTLVNGTVTSISGRLGNMLYKTYRNGTTKAYLYHKAERSTPLSEAEKTTRTNFALIASEVAKRMRAGDKRPKNIIWQEVSLEIKNSTLLRGK